MESTTKVLTIFAPAKINLYLHVTGRMDNGYHSLDSLIAFADIGDEVTIAPSSEFQFRAEGPYSKTFSAKEMDASPDSSNLAVQAAWGLAQAAQKVLNVRITLTKNLPLASGMGGGSSDAAAVLWGLTELWGIPRNTSYLSGLMARLGADVPVCMPCRPARIRGIGDILDPAPALPEVAVVLINPGTPCPTGEVFARFTGDFKNPQAMPDTLGTLEGLTAFLQAQSNDLEEAAMTLAPGVKAALSGLRAQKECVLARMSGSGATCFGLFRDERAAQKAAQGLASRNPGWWVKTGWLNRPERY